MNGPRLDVDYGAFWGLEKYIMSGRFTRLSLWLTILLSSEVLAIGLGEIELDSALNEPLRAEIQLLSATPAELADLKITLASPETFDRYGIDRPVYLHGVEFNIVDRGVENSVVQIRSRAPISEPFLTFLIEATWSSGRLLREYTVLLDPPTYAPPAVQQAPAVEAPRRSTPSDAGRIERQSTSIPEPAPTPAPLPVEPARSGNAVFSESYDEPAPEPESRSGPAVDSAPYSSSSSGDFYVVKGQTLWGVAAHLRPDSRLTINQTMLSIYEANPDAFGGNINIMKAGASLRIPSADEVFQISRNAALSEVQRQHSAWGSSDGYSAPEPSSRPSLTLVPPDEEPVSSEYDDTSSLEQPSREQEIASRISDLEAADVPNQQSLISIRDNELAALRQELADIRGEVYEPPVSDTVDDAAADDSVVDDAMTDDAEIDGPFVDDVAADDATAENVDDSLVAEDSATSDDAEADTTVPTNIIRTSSSEEKGIVDRIIEFLSAWGIIIGALVVVAGGLIWFVRRGSDDDDDDEISRPWETLDSDETQVGEFSASDTVQVPALEEAIVVVEANSGVNQILDDTIEAPPTDFAPSDGSSPESYGSIEDTFSSETAVNFDQSDPIAEADFHMAYGLYDQAADLINGALQTDSTDEALLSKLCEIYFVWGNRDEFVDAATRLRNVVGEGDGADWHKIVIMGQQIAADHDLFAGAEVANATRDVDLSFDADDVEASALDMDFGADDGSNSDGDADATDGGIDFNFEEPASESNVDNEIDFDLDVTGQSPTIDIPATDATVDMPATEATAEMPAATIDSPTIDEPFLALDVGTSELPSFEESSDQAASGGSHNSDETAEINLDELDLDLGGLDETEIASLDDLDPTGHNEALSETGINEALSDLESTALIGGLDMDSLEDTGIRLAADETGQRPMVPIEDDQDLVGLDIDDSLLEATGMTQILSDEMGVESVAGIDANLLDDVTMLAPDMDKTIDSLPQEAETMLAPLDDEDDFDFAKTEALPPDAFTGIADLESTVETPAIAGTDVDLDLDDLTAALKVSEIGDALEYQGDDATVEQPRPIIAPDDDMSGDLHEARTMTEVGTKLDLARAYVDMGDPAGARSILDEVLDEGDDGQKQQAQQLLDSLPS
jgi:pilus assembly protein FimV